MLILFDVSSASQVPQPIKSMPECPDYTRDKNSNCSKDLFNEPDKIDSMSDEVRSETDLSLYESEKSVPAKNTDEPNTTDFLKLF